MPSPSLFLLAVVTALCLAGAAATLAILLDSVKPFLMAPEGAQKVLIHRAIGDTQ